jgi:hypothetical protein
MFETEAGGTAWTKWICTAIGHRWHACCCQRCGEWAHVWNGCLCRKCSAERDVDHRWSGCVCLTCKVKRDVNHHMEECRCTVCGVERHSWDRYRCLRCGRTRDLLSLQTNGLMHAEASGLTITQVTVKLTSLCETGPTPFLIEPGWYFVADGHHQNMVITQMKEGETRARESMEFILQAACLNAHLPVPRRGEKLSKIGLVDRDLKQFLDAAQHDDPMVIQAGVWALTDKLGPLAIQFRLEKGSWLEREVAIKPEHISEAGERLRQLGISSTIS